MDDVIPQGDVIVVEDRVDMECMRHVHLMSNSSAVDVIPIQGAGTAPLQWVKEVGVWHFRSVHPFRGALDVMCEGWVKARRLVVWSLVGCPSVRFGLFEAANEFERLFGGRARFGFVKSLPRGAEHGMDVGDVTLLEAEWMLGRCVAVGGRMR